MELRIRRARPEESEALCALVLAADPNARPFYEHMGAVIVSWKDSATVPGQRNPHMRFELAGR